MPPVKPVQVSPTSSLLPLRFPQSVAVFDNYEDAQKAVDHLSDHEFPVENLCIVGTDLKLVERVLGRRSWPQVIASGAVSGIGTGLLLGLLWMLFLPGIGSGKALVAGVVLGIAMGVLSAAMAHGASGGRRDFSSVTATVATRYEVLGEHQVVTRAREMLQEMPGFRAMQLRSSTAAAPAAPQVPVQQAPVQQPVQQWPVAQQPPQAPTQQAPDQQAAWTPASGAHVAGSSDQGWQRPVSPQAESRPAPRPAVTEPEPEPIYSPWPVHPSTDNQFRDQDGTAAD